MNIFSSHTGMGLISGKLLNRHCLLLHMFYIVVIIHVYFILTSHAIDSAFSFHIDFFFSMSLKCLRDLS